MTKVKAWLNIHVILPKVKDGFSACCANILIQPMVCCTVDPVQCTEGHDVEQEINVPITQTNGTFRGRS